MKLKQSDLAKIKPQLVAEQNGLCIMCGEDLTRTKAVNQVIDHCHKTGFVRGVAHRGCNMLEGKIRNVMTRWGSCSTDQQIASKLSGFKEFFENPPKTEYIHPTHKTPAEKRAAQNKKARARYAAKKKETSLGKRKA